MEPISFSLKEYYLWRKNTETQFPWKRQYLNQEFLKCEQKRIKELVKWRSNFHKKQKGDELEEVSFYSVPVELNSFWKGAIAEEGEYNYIGLSGLQNSPSILTLGLIPLDVKQPPEYSLIYITKAKKSFLHNKNNNFVYPVIIIEAWEILSSDKLYVDVPYEKSHIQKLIKENLIGDENTSLSFQSPILSSPYVAGSIGGISLSSISGNSLFSQELIKTILKMTPPEYRGIKPPESVYRGGKIEDIEGVSFHLAERPSFDKNYLSGISDFSARKLKEEILRRNKFIGEYSIFSTITPPSFKSTSIWNELLKGFTETEITLPEDLDTLPEVDVDLTRMNNAINEDLWIQVVSARQINPPIDNNASILLNQTLKRLKDDFDAILSNANKNEIQREYIVKNMLYNTGYNVKRLTQSFARSENRNDLEEGDFSKARNLIVDNFNGFINHPKFENLEYFMSVKKDNSRFSILQTTLINNPKLTIHEIYDYVKSTDLFKDITDLQGLMDWCQKGGFVWIDNNNKYEWV